MHYQNAHMYMKETKGGWQYVNFLITIMRMSYLWNDSNIKMAVSDDTIYACIIEFIQYNDNTKYTTLYTDIILDICHDIFIHDVLRVFLFCLLVKFCINIMNWSCGVAWHGGAMY